MRGTLVAVCAVLALHVVPASAQDGTRGVLEGTAVDPMQQALADAAVSVSDGTTVVATTRTDAAGRFSLALPAGEFAVTVSSPGFADSTQRVSVRAGRTISNRFQLSVAGVRDSVLITAEAGRTGTITSATRTPTPLRDLPQSVTVIGKEQIRDQMVTNVAELVRYVPGISSHQGENNRDQVIIRGNSSSADFFVNGVRDDVQYYRDLYNLERFEALKGPNALMFGRGGAGGVVNRVTKDAIFSPVRDFTLQGGTFDNKRLAGDFGQALSKSFALRLNGVVEDSDSFRRSVTLERAAVNPTFTFVPSSATRITGGYEYLHDERVADRGITSYQGRPANVPIETYYGNASDSSVRADVNLVQFAVEHQLRPGVLLRNRTMAANYDRFYQNYVPGAANADATLVTLTAYNNATERSNLFNQTDVSLRATTGRVNHTVLIGAEFGQQLTDNFRKTGFFNDTTTSIQVPFGDPTTTTPVTFRQNATDADNHIRTSIAAVFIQDQVELNPHVQLLGGLRYDRFNIRVQNHRTAEDLSRPDDLVSPRAGIVVKPSDPVSLYGSYSVSYLPSSGDQFSQLTVITQQVEPEKFTNYELGAKWDVRDSLGLTTAVYRLDRTNTRATDPNDLSRIVQTGSQRATGFEIGIDGRVLPAWTITGGYAFQHARVTSATVSAKEGAIVGQVPRHTFSLWNKYQVFPRVAAAVGLVQRSDMFATIDNSVVLPGYVEMDAGVYVTVTNRLRLQFNVENIGDVEYIHNADSNTNLSPGLPRAFRVGLTTGF